MNKSSVVDGMLLAVGIFLLLQTAGSIIGIVEDSQENPILFTMAFLPIFFGAAGIWCLRKVHNRRKKRKSQEQAQEQTPIGVRTVSIQKQRKMPAGVALIAGMSIASGFAGLLLGPLAAAGFDPILNLSAEFRLFYGAMAAAAGAASIIIAYGMFTAKRWAWFWGLVGLYVSVAWSVTEISLRSDAITQISFAAGIPLYAIMLYYMYRPHVKAYFGRIPTAPHS